MKKFSLEEYLKNPNRGVVTRDGRDVRIICTDRESEDKGEIVALVKHSMNGVNEESILGYSQNGTVYDNYESSWDLFFTTTKKEGWMNVYKDRDLGNIGGNIYESEQDARKAKAGCKDSEWIDTIKIEWEE